MGEAEFLKKIKKIGYIICISEFGSYETEYWNEGRSDIDLAVVVKPKVSFMDTLEIEDEILELSKQYYNYNKIHLTFILFKDFPSRYARIAVDSNKRYIIEEELWYDFRHYVIKYARNNLNFEKMLKIDEQYSYFGGITDETLL
ncbi:nucleotidyltransferase domain-containing protein [Clostridium sp.]|uniref:nucleotidyltransferase domain-containing protein n=1 Tax=Clostridium sp. TaxID=1506 RepID=UPI00284F56E2|nr:nucleotidyltransferase domain-containing protein [Clostridium sp.]MDR3594848.1 nucleotidyltransferase domain-containing protein [Clostridium sp.]